MCGIVGYNGFRNAQEEAMRGLEKLEYRGYDSAGIITLKENEFSLFKEAGKLENLKNVLEKREEQIGIGHTRWATHGKATKNNAHPHVSNDGRFALVHNGIIENYLELKLKYLPHLVLNSETDTEIIVQLLQRNAEKEATVEEAFAKTLRMLKGSYAIAMVDKKDEGTIYAAKNKSPLLIGLGEKENMICSDAMAFIHITKKYQEIKDEEYVILKKDSVVIKHIITEHVITRPYFLADLDQSDLEKGLYDHFMLKEIDEQPVILRNLSKEYLAEDSINFDPILIEEMKRSKRIWIIACGTSYHAGLIGKRMIENKTDKDVTVFVASEFATSPPKLKESTFVVYISQSGETADSREALRVTNSMGIPSLTITNVKGSTLSRETDHTALLFAGPEIAVASTKAYTAQLTVLMFLSYALKNEQDKKELENLRRQISRTAAEMEILVGDKEKIKELAKTYLMGRRNAFFIGRGADFDVSLESALKLKEISYIQAEGFAGGELKHGTIALIEDGTPIIALNTIHKTAELLRSNIEEVKARGANVLVISRSGMEAKDDQVILPLLSEEMYPFLTVVVTQLFSYYAALQNNCDIDKPRNLAKSVTVF
jgi:glucosamine--fructose-6-phosphate aminotransferase (isomerizing)